MADELLCRLPAALPTGMHAFEVSLNAQEYTSSGLNFTVYGEPAVQALCPSSGPTLGETAVRVVGATRPEQPKPQPPRQARHLRR